jgi:hypothetical protein
MSQLTPLFPRLYFSYGQFFVHDSTVTAPGCVWTDSHSAQGFARRESVICFGTLLEFGYADLSYSLSSYEPKETYERVIAVPVTFVTGRVVIDGPEEIGVERGFEVRPGNYQVVAAQRVVGVDREVIDLFVEAVCSTVGKSRIIVSDGQLDPPSELVETADVA